MKELITLAFITIFVGYGQSFNGDYLLKHVNLNKEQLKIATFLFQEFGEEVSLEQSDSETVPKQLEAFFRFTKDAALPSYSKSTTEYPSLLKDPECRTSA